MDNLFRAIKKNDIDKVKDFLQSVEDVNKLIDGWSPLFIACNFDKIEIVKLLLSRPEIDVNVRTDGGMTPLYIASISNHTKIVKLLLSRPDINVNSNNILHTVSKFNNIKMLKVFLKYSIKHPDLDINGKDYDGGMTPLHLACQENNIEIVKLLLTHPKIDVNAKNYNRNTSLYIACNLENIEIVKLLLSHPKIDVNIKDSEDKTILQVMMNYDKFEVINLLLAHPNIDVNVKDKNGRTLLYIACVHHQDYIRAELLLKHPKIKVDFKLIKFRELIPVYKTKNSKLINNILDTIEN